MNEERKPSMTFYRIDDIFEHAGQPYSGKRGYAERKTNNARSYYKLPVVNLVHNKLM